eukprot:12934227-Prorocentrum_lima.AAC.1
MAGQSVLSAQFPRGIAREVPGKAGEIRPIRSHFGSRHFGHPFLSIYANPRLPSTCVMASPLEVLHQREIRRSIIMGQSRQRVLRL